MAQPPADQVEFALDRCIHAGVVTHWVRRPLGLYHVYEWDGDFYTFDRKEAILWAQGVISGIGFAAATESAGHELPPPPTPAYNERAGWFPNPDDRGRTHRWFDGIRWTDVTKAAPR